MNNVTLYRKYRPMGFDDIVGQAHVVRTIKNAIATNSVAHAYLFAGPRGTGKTTMARILAKAVNCTNAKAKDAPCGTCMSCNDIMLGKAMDIIEIDAASNRGIDEARELREAVRVSPAQYTKKVYIIDESHQLTKDAFNTLLKTLEEPPEHVMFIFATTDPDKMPKTILSRVQRFDFKKFSIDEIIGKLQKIGKSEKREITEDALRQIAAVAEGGMRDAESMLDQVFSYSTEKITQDAVEEVLGIVGIEHIAQLIDICAEKKFKEAIVSIHTMADKGVNADILLKSLVDYIRKLMLLRADKTLRKYVALELTDEQFARILEQGEKWQQKELEHMFSICMEAQENMKKTAIPMLPLELVFMQLIGEEEK